MITPNVAKLTQDGITFQDFTSVIKREWIFPAGTDWVFFQASAPTGWTKQTTHNNKALRLVSGTGGGSGGTQPFTTVCSPSFKYAGTLNTTTATGDKDLRGPDPTGMDDAWHLPSHTHPNPGRFTVNAVPALYNPAGQFTGWNGGDLRRAGGWSRTYQPFTGYTGGPAGTAKHKHPVSGSGPVNTTFTLGVRYMNVIVCSFNG